MPTPLCREVAVISLTSNAALELQGGGLFSLLLENPGWDTWRPGQFVMLRRKTPRADCLWARPFSICDLNGDGLHIVFQALGRETAEFARLAPGEKLTVWGPLGNGFSLEKSRPTLLLAGGIGLAPFVGYIRSHPAPERLSLNFGHRLPLECYPFAACSSGHCSSIRATSYLERCAEDLQEFICILERDIRANAAEKGLILACGPMPFLRTVHAFSRQYGARTELSLETRMACGVGACLGCVVKGRKSDEKHTGGTADTDFGWVQTCSCGPVFRAEDLDLEAS